MEKTCSQLKDDARRSLLGHYTLTVAASLLAELLTILLRYPFSTRLSQGIAYQRPFRIVTGYAGILLAALVGGLLIVGLYYIHLQIARGRQTGYADLLYGFRNHPDRFIGLWFVMFLASFVCTLPAFLCFSVSGTPLLPEEMTPEAFVQSLTDRLHIAGILLGIAGYLVLFLLLLGWSQSVYLLLDHPQLKVLEAIRASRQSMRGRKGKLFFLCLSFIGWALLGLLTLGLGYLWIVPYMLQSQTQFYLQLCPAPQSEENADR